MKKTKPLHPLSILRQITGLTQKEIAAMAGTSVKYIKSVERRKKREKNKEGEKEKIFRLSRDVASMIALRTGASKEWLLKGDPEMPPLNTELKPYTIVDFKQAQRGKVVTFPDLRKIVERLEKSEKSGKCNLDDMREAAADFYKINDDLTNRFGQLLYILSHRDDGELLRTKLLRYLEDFCKKHSLK